MNNRSAMFYIDDGAENDRKICYIKNEKKNFKDQLH